MVRGQGLVGERGGGGGTGFVLLWLLSRLAACNWGRWAGGWVVLCKQRKQLVDAGRTQVCRLSDAHQWWCACAAPLVFGATLWSAAYAVHSWPYAFGLVVVICGVLCPQMTLPTKRGVSYLGSRCTLINTSRGDKMKV